MKAKLTLMAALIFIVACKTDSFLSPRKVLEYRNDENAQAYALTFYADSTFAFSHQLGLSTISYNGTWLYDAQTRGIKTDVDTSCLHHRITVTDKNYGLFAIETFECGSEDPLDVRYHFFQNGQVLLDTVCFDNELYFSPSFDSLVVRFLGSELRLQGAQYRNQRLKIHWVPDPSWLADERHLIQNIRIANRKKILLSDGKVLHSVRSRKLSN